MLFCAFCGSLLLLERQDQVQYACPCCAYVCPVKTTLVLAQDFAGKTVDESAVGADDSTQWDLVTMRCNDEACDSTKAYCAQVQLRSADEPATLFFKCAECQLRWRQD
jgi:DNA-directed RNA polymerase III subunit RPC11